jgi:uncharacterized protein (TIRG00374 family)
VRNLLLAVLLLLFVGFVITRAAEVQQIAAILRRGDARWLSLALFLQLVWLVNIGASLRAIFRALGAEEKILDLVVMATIVNLVSVITPTVGMGGMAYFISQSRRRGHPSGRATTAAVMYLVYDYFAALIVIGLGLIVLVRRHQLTQGEIFAAAFLAVYAGVLGFLLYLGMRSAERLGRALATMGTVGNRILRPILKRDRFDIRHAHEYARDIAKGSEAARRSPGGLLLPAALALSNKALLISILFLVFLAFRQAFSVGTLIAGYSIGALFAVVSPTPSGIGFVEGAMTLALRTLNVPLASAAVITLAYRGVTFWFPLVLGFAVLRWAHRITGRPMPA